MIDLGLSVPSVAVRHRTAGGVGPGPLDLTSGAIAAYSQRALSAAKRGTALFTLQRDSDNTTQSFNSDATTGDAPTSAISSWIGAANAVVTLWKDQSSGGKDVIPDSVGLAPPFLLSISGGRPGLDFPVGEGKYLNGGTITLADGLCIFLVSKWTTAAIGDAVGGFNTGGNTSYFNFDLQTNGASPGALIETDLFDSATSHEAGSSFSWVRNDTSFHVFEAVGQFGANSFLIDGAPLTPSTSNDFGAAPSSPVTVPFFIGTNSTSGNPFDGTMQELVIYQGVPSSATRTAIRRNMAAYYGITVP